MKSTMKQPRTKSLNSKTLSRQIPAIIATFTLACLVAVPAIGAGKARGVPFQADRIEGLWTAHVDVFNCATGMGSSFEAMALFAANGTFHDTNSTDPTARSASFGTWQHLGGNVYEFAFRFFRFSEGVYQGWNVIRHRVELAADGQSYFSEGTAEIYNTVGVVVGTGCSRAAAIRFN